LSVRGEPIPALEELVQLVRRHPSAKRWRRTGASACWRRSSAPSRLWRRARA
jgi:hypothetical protein